MSVTKPDVDPARIAEFCHRWQITEYSLFGSILREDFRDDSDVDVLVTFLPAADWSLLDLMTMKEELELLYGRRVDLVEQTSLKNPFRRRSILSTRKVIHAG